MHVCMYVMYHVVRAQSVVSQLSASTRQSVLSASGSGRRRSVKDLLDIKAEMRRKALVQVTYIHTYIRFPWVSLR